MDLRRPAWFVIFGGVVACERAADLTDPNPVPAAAGDWWMDAVPSLAVDGGDPLAELNVVEGAADAVFATLPHRGFAFASHDWESAGWVLHDVLTVAEDGSDLAVTFAYCQGDRALWVYTESLLQPLSNQPLDGPCAVRPGDRPIEVETPPLLTLPPPRPTGFVVESPDLSLYDDGGTARIGGAERTIHPFEVVDCTDCPDGPWMEVHALWLSPGDACFGILYLYPERRTVAEVHHGVCLPSLIPLNGTFEVTWSELAGRRRPRHRGPGVPPPLAAR